jgi:formate-dependent nitrite reductase membrane component NrfD
MLKNALAAADWNKYLAIAICILAILIVILSFFCAREKEKKCKII